MKKFSPSIANVSDKLISQILIIIKFMASTKSCSLCKPKVIGK